MNDTALCFSHIHADGCERRFTYGQVHQLVRDIAEQLKPCLVDDKPAVVVDLPNCPLFIGALLACAQLGVPLVALNHRLSPAEKELRLSQLEPNLHAVVIIDEGWGRMFETSRQIEPDVHAEADRQAAPTSQPAENWSPANLLQEADRSALALVMFTSGTTGTPKAAALTWGNLLASAEASNASLACSADSLWQAVLPLCHIGGLQVALRSFLAGCPFLLYTRCDAERLLNDASALKVTHLSVVDKILQDLIVADASLSRHVLPTYECLLLGGAAPNEKTLEAALNANARVYASFGMTETASQVANRLVDEKFDGGLVLLPSTHARILDPDEDGVGTLALSGPSVINSYLGIPTPHTEDGFLVTGDRAYLRAEDGSLVTDSRTTGTAVRLHVCERLGDLFISGGENVYPAEVERCICEVAGVTASYVFGMKDETWGRRPAALVESADNPKLIEDRVREHVTQDLSTFSQPDLIVVVPKIPRMGIGKIDRSAAEELVLERGKANR